MRIAIVGAGSFAKHFVDELHRANHDAVLLTRSHKAQFDGKPGLVEQHITDYKSVDALTSLLHDCDGVVTTVHDTTQAYADLHLALLEACKRTPKCKRFIPAEFGGNSEDFPEDPESKYKYGIVVKNALRAQRAIEWTIISVGWLADYVVPSTNRYHPNIGPLHPLDWATKTMTITGTGHEPFTTTSARDVAAAVAHLFQATTKWRPYTYVQGEVTTWLSFAELVRTTGGLGDELKIMHESVEEVQKVLEAKESEEAMMVAEFKLFVPWGALCFDPAKVHRDRDDYFPSVRFRTMKELAEAVKNDPSVVV